jgi:ABC-type amino acid transport system permease subunit
MRASSADRRHPLPARVLIAFIRAVPLLFTIAMWTLATAFFVAGKSTDALVTLIPALLASSVALRVTVLGRR